MAAFDHKIIERSFPGSITGTWKKGKAAYILLGLPPCLWCVCNLSSTNVRDIKREGKGDGYLILHLSFLLSSLKQHFMCSLYPTTQYIIFLYIVFLELLLFSKEKEKKGKKKRERDKGQRSNLTFILNRYGRKNNFQMPRLTILTLHKTFTLKKCKF